MDVEHGAGTATLVPQRVWPDVDHVITEDDTPVDGGFSTHEMRLLVNILTGSWAGPNWDRRFHCDANVGVFESVNLPPIVPDFFLVLGVVWPQPIRLKRNRSYFIEGIGKPPELVIEIVSNDEGGEDTRKLEKYAHLNVRYCLIHDPDRILSNEVLRIYELIGGQYQRLAGTWLAGVDLGVVLWYGTVEGVTEYWLRWVDREGRLIPTEGERALQERAEREAAELLVAQERLVREAAEQRAEQERAEREAAEQRIAELEARLRLLEPPERRSAQ